VDGRSQSGAEVARTRADEAETLAPRERMTFLLQLMIDLDKHAAQVTSYSRYPDDIWTVRIWTVKFPGDIWTGIIGLRSELGLVMTVQLTTVQILTVQISTGNHIQYFLFV